MNAIQLVKTRRGCECCETTPRYDVVHDGRTVGQLYWNLRGYCGVLPLPEGGNVSIGERPISAYKAEVARLNREFAYMADLRVKFSGREKGSAT